MAKGEMNPSIGDQYIPFSSTGNLVPGNCSIIGIWISGTTSGTLTLYDSSTTGTGHPIIAVTTFASIGFYPLPVKVSSGVYAVVTNTLTATLVYANP